MSTAAQCSANAQNALASTGPKSDLGKARASRNRTTHGLRAKAPVLDTFESEAEWQAHYEDWLEDLQPSGEFEQQCAYTIALTSWKLARTEEVEVNLVNLQTRDRFEEWRASAKAATEAESSEKSESAMSRARAQLLPQGQEGSLLLRYRNEANRQFWKAHAELRRAQAERSTLQRDIKTLEKLLSLPLGQSQEPAPKPSARPAPAPAPTSAPTPAPAPPTPRAPQAAAPPAKPPAEPESTPQTFVVQGVTVELGSNGAATYRLPEGLSKNAKRRLIREIKQQIEREMIKTIRSGNGSSYVSLPTGANGRPPGSR